MRDDGPDLVGFVLVLLGVIALCVFLPEPTRDPRPTAARGAR